ncbi:glycosyltransferase [Thermocrinis sp.]
MSSDFIRPRITNKNEGLYGHVDFINQQGIGGWVLDAQSNEPRIVEIYIGEEKVGEALANMQRPDISQILGKETKCGFYVRWSELKIPNDLDDLNIAIIDKLSGREIFGKHAKGRKAKNLVEGRLFFNVDSIKVRGNRIYGWGWLFHKDFEVEDIKLICDFEGNYYEVPINYGSYREDVYRDYMTERAKHSGFVFSGRMPFTCRPDKCKFFIDTFLQNGKSHRILVPYEAVIYLERLLHEEEAKFASILKKDEEYVLIIDHNLGGGTNLYRNRLIIDLKNSHHILLLTYRLPNLDYQLDYFYGEYNEAFTFGSLPSVLSILDRVRLNQIILNNLVSFDDHISILQWIYSKKLSDRNLSITVNVHDFFCICPVYSLINSKGHFCGIPLIQECEKCLKNHKMKEFLMLTDFRDIYKHRDEWSKVLGISDRIVCFSKSSLDLLKRAYPYLDSSKVQIKSHEVGEFRKVNVNLNSPLRIGIVGNISNEAKGENIVKEIVKIIEKRNLPIKVVVIGSINRGISSPILEVTGQYNREELPNIVEKSGANVFFHPSICPETFSFVVNELIKLGVPLAVFDIGAQAEYVKQYNLGLVIEKVDPEYVVESIIKFYEDLRKSRLTFKHASKYGKVKVFTSANINYLPKVRVLSKTLKKYNPELEMNFVLVDKIPSWLDISKEPFDKIILIEDIKEIPLKSWIFKYSVVELCTAVKPFAFKKLLDDPKCEMVLYFDPDIALFSSIDGLIQELSNSNIILTPHQTKPEEEYEAIMDNEICSLKYGIFNLGFIGVRKTDESFRFLNWWSDRLNRFSWAELDQGVWTDQKWINFAPIFFEGVKIIKSSRFNVAPWNITTRKLEGSFEKGFTVDGEPLCFYHFTGFDSGAHKIMAMKYNSNNEAVKNLIQWYEKMLEENKVEHDTTFGYLIDRFENGEPITEAHRIIYKRRRDLQEVYPDPFKVVENGQCYYNWFKWRAHIEHPDILKKYGGY